MRPAASPPGRPDKHLDRAARAGRGFLAAAAPVIRRNGGCIMTALMVLVTLAFLACVLLAWSRNTGM